MTATQTRPTSPPRARRRRSSSGDRTAVRRTLLALLASGLGVFPLKELFSDYGWLVDVWLSMIIVIVPAALLRRRRAPGALDIWPGIVLLVPWLTLRFLSDTAAAGFIPMGQTWSTLSTLLTQLHETTRDEVAPIATTVPVRLVLCALVGLLAALVDLIAVVGRRGALAGVPLLVVFTVCGAVPRTPVAWPWFALAAVGFLVLLALDAGDEHDRWGRRIGAPGRAGAAGGRGADRAGRAGSVGSTAGSAFGVSAPRIAIVAVIAAVALPLLVPGEPRNLLANAFHGGGGISGLSGSGGDNGRISPFVDLKGELERKDPVKLADVQMIGTSGTAPYYLRSNVLSDYTGSGWRVASHGSRNSINGNDFSVEPAQSPRSVSLTARIDVDNLRDNPVVFNYPERITGLNADATNWSPSDQLLLDSSINQDTSYTIQFRQPEPTTAQLQAASDEIDPAVRSELAVPASVPAYVRNVVRDEIAGKTTQYAKARALSDYFNDPKNGFVYDLKTATGTSGNALVDFLQNRRGFCQQYASALGIMLRVAGVPARVVIGYLNSGPDENGKFTVSTLDAHAWVEGWFAGVGWVPFDPTPAAGLPGGGATLPWAPRDIQKNLPSSSAPTPSSSSSTSAPTSTSAAPSTSAMAAPDTGSSSSSPTPWFVLAGLLVAAFVLLSPATVRSLRRRRRLHAARGGDAEALWSELSDTATDLGYVWSDARSPRQVASWLAPDAPASAASLQALAEAVEFGRYSRSGSGGPPIADAETAAVRDLADQLRARRSLHTRLRARFLPASLGWIVPPGRRGRREL